MDNRLLTVQNIGSDGFEIELIMKNGKIIDAVGIVGNINKLGYINPYQKSHFKHLSKRSKGRITEPMLRVGVDYKKISFEEAFKIINEKIKSVNPDENIFIASSTLTNEEQYSIQKMARQGVKTKHVNSIQYWGKENVKDLTSSNVAIFELNEAEMFGNNFKGKNPPIYADGIYDIARMLLNTNAILFDDTFVSNTKTGISNINQLCKSFIDNQLCNEDIISRIPNYESYKKRVMGVKYNSYGSEMSLEVLRGLFEGRPIYLIKEDIDIVYFNEIMNYFMLRGLLGQLYTGPLVIREECNSEGIFDMGCIPTLGVGRKEIDNNTDYNELISNGAIKNAFIFDNMNKSLRSIDLNNVDFVVYQTSSLNKQCKADMILPASFHYEIGGTFTNTCHNIQKFNAVVESPLEYNSLEQYARILNDVGVEHPNNNTDIFTEIIPFLKKKCGQRGFDGFIKHTN